ncbi:mCG147084 [Mus musculus]|nr:mCG147084 [Mus musculus]
MMPWLILAIVSAAKNSDREVSSFLRVSVFLCTASVASDSNFLRECPWLSDTSFLSGTAHCLPISCLSSHASVSPGL